MDFLIDVIISFTIVIPALIGLVKFKKMDRSFLPFILLIWISVVNEIVSLITINLFHSNTINYNIHILVKALLITWQFNKWKLFERAPKLYRYLLIGLLATWIIEVMFISSIIVFASYFIILHSFIIVLMSINILNKLIVKEQDNLLKNSVFLICIGFVILFTFSALIEIFMIYGINESGTFMINVYAILAYTNLFVNLLFAVAILWVPKRQIFLTPS